MATVDQVIDAAIAKATENQELTTLAVQAAIAAAQIVAPHPTLADSQLAFEEVDRGDVGHNVVRFDDLPPPSLDLDDIILKYDAYANTDELAQGVKADFAQYLTDYFPNCLPVVESACAKLRDWIENGGTGIDPAVLNQIWDLQRAREDVLGMRERDAAIDAEARRGWSLPQGATQARLFMANQAVIDRVANLGRQIAIDEATREQENIRFAITTVIESQFRAHQAAADFVRAAIQGKLLGLQNVQELANASARLYQSSIDYFNARVRAEALNRDYEELSLRPQETLLSVALREKGIDNDTLVASIRNRTDAAMAAARVFGSSAAAALSSTNSMVTQIVNED